MHALPHTVALDIRPATSEAERDHAYRLRYDVFVLEGGDRRYADPTRQRHIDADDRAASTVVVAYADGTPCATYRMTRLRDLSFIGAHNYRLPLLAGLVGLPLPDLRSTLARFDRLAVTPPMRGKGVFERLVHHFYDLATASGCVVAVAAYRSDNPKPRHAFHRNGWAAYGEPVAWRGKTFENIYIRFPTSCSE